jgi:hypothetical protein
MEWAQHQYAGVMLNQCSWSYGDDIGICIVNEAHVAA